jgi:membrane protease YdiL (CAAX protease family)
VSLPVEAYLFVAKDRPLATFLGALMLPPLVRVVSLSIPTAYFTTVEWLAIVGVPLLLAAAAVMNAAGLRRADVFLGLGERRYIAINILIIFIGFGLGFVEYRILRPEPWIPASDRGQLPFAVVAIFLTNGLAEELIFRGILLRTGVALMGRQGALLYVTLVFTVLHVGFMSVPDLVFVFVVGLVFGIAVLFTRSLWGVVGAHTLANVALYLILPFGF